MTTRSLILVHGHPELSPGGGERAAFTLFHHLKANDRHCPLLVARATGPQIGHGGSFRIRNGRNDEVLVAPPPVDPFTLLSRDHRRLGALLDELIALHNPSVAHLQHFAFWGVDVLQELRSRGLRIVMTLHEFLLLCHRDGQMLTTDGKLCRQAMPIACASCFPAYSAGAFFVRKKILLKQLDAVETFISPSAFLAERFASWGLDRRRIVVIENPAHEDQLAEAARTPERAPVQDKKARLKLGYFGQVTAYKGLQVLLNALELLDLDCRDQVSLAVHGTLSVGLTDKARAELDQSLRRLRRRVEWRGAYEAHETLGLMQDIDVVVVPSIWWENSPVVIQEARLAGRPILCSDIGGMAEKAAEIAGSQTFRTGSAQHLAARIEALLRERESAQPEVEAKAIIERRDAALGAHRAAAEQLLRLLEGERLPAKPQRAPAPA